ncbi:1094_t:CDS:1, partial [Scutellospora calospora]
KMISQNEETLTSITNQTTPNPSVNPINFGNFGPLLLHLTEKELHIVLNPPLLLSLTIDEFFAPAKRPTKNPNPPRYLNSYLLWKRNYDASHTSKNFTQRSRESSVMWSRSDDEIKLFFKILSKLHKSYHELMYPEYKYSPKRNNSSKVNARL